MPCGRVEGPAHVRAGFADSLYQRVAWLMLTAALDAALPGLGNAARRTRVIVDSAEAAVGAPVAFDPELWLSLTPAAGEDGRPRFGPPVPGLAPGQRPPHDAMILERPRSGGDDEFHEVLAVRRPVRSPREGQRPVAEPPVEEERPEDERILTVARAVSALAALAEEPKSRERARQVALLLPPALGMDPADVARVLDGHSGRDEQERFQRALDDLVAECQAFGEEAVAAARRRRARRDHPARVPGRGAEFRVVLRCALDDLGARIVDGPAVLRYARSVVHLMTYQEGLPWTAARSVRTGRAVRQVVLVDEDAGIALNVEVVDGVPRCSQILAAGGGRLTLWEVPSRAGVVPIR
ncbi:hypothetical protein ACSNOI_29680 [Actinomadura kijaniata]|uniref:hypothetical protein n=1 Tax=Actinomadura kijaniata TaxID=46161 RepID=UPI003F1B9AC8